MPIAPCTPAFNTASSFLKPWHAPRDNAHALPRVLEHATATSQPRAPSEVYRDHGEAPLRPHSARPRQPVLSHAKPIEHRSHGFRSYLL
eukprot:1623250-Amphidinium_carterae.1